MAKLIAFTTDEGMRFIKVPKDWWVTSCEVRQYPPDIFTVISAPGENRVNPWSARHESIPVIFFALLFDDGQVWDAELARPEMGSEGNGWSQIEEEHLKVIHSDIEP